MNHPNSAKPNKGKARLAIGEIANRTFKALVASYLAEKIRELGDWLFS